MRSGFAIAGIAAVIFAAPAAAADQGLELRAGGAISGIELGTWHFTPDIATFDVRNLDTLDLGLIVDLPQTEALDWIGSPRLEAGTLINLRGRESLAHLGLNWHVPVFDTPVFLELGLGAALHNGSPIGERPLRDLGCPFAIHYSYGVGVDIADDWTLTAKFQHISHGGLCGETASNMGLNNFGLVAGYKF